MQSAIIGAFLLVIVGCVQSQVHYPDQLIGLNALDRQLALGRNVRVGGRGSRFARNQIAQQQMLMDQQQALNNAIVSQQLRGGLVGNVGVVGGVGVPVVSTVVGGAGYGVAGGVGLTGLSGCCSRTDQQACIAVRPLSSYGSGATCQRWYYDALTGTCQRATFDLVCATGRGFTNYFKSQALCLAKCGGAVVGGY